MSSSLNNTEGVNRINRLNILKNILVLKMNLTKKKPPILLVRNPYNRVVSVYFDKFKTNKWFKRNRLEQIQNLFLKEIDPVKNWDTNSILAEFESLTFDKYLELLLKLYDKDAHTRPQIKLLERFLLNPNHFQIVKIEEKDVLDGVFQQLNINVPKVNVTKKENFTLTEDQKDIIYKIYTKDFLTFKYPK